jgi:RNA polymerase sigma-70 factor (ECF subfamily)
VRRDARALAAFERHFISRVGAFLAREDALPSFTDEVKQTLRARLLVAEGALLPRLGQYGGRGPLGAWLWMITTRIALDLRRAQRGGEVTSDALALLADRTVTPDPELAYLKTHYGAAFRAVFREVLAALPKRDGTLLRLHYLEGMTTEQLGAFYGVSRWTAARRIERLCRSVLKEARRTLAARLDLPTSQLDSVLQLVKSELQLSLADVLGR